MVGDTTQLIARRWVADSAVNSGIHEKSSMGHLNCPAECVSGTLGRSGVVSLLKAAVVKPNWVEHPAGKSAECQAQGSKSEARKNQAHERALQGVLDP